MTPDEIQIENDKIVKEVTEKAWNEVISRVKDFSPGRQFIILSRITGFFVANIYVPAFQMTFQAIIPTDEKPASDHDLKSP